jgi:hypothetical protein
MLGNLLPGPVHRKLASITQRMESELPDPDVDKCCDALKIGITPATLKAVKTAKVMRDTSLGDRGRQFPWDRRSAYFSISPSTAFR